jgi:CheY-like chemotaxis protein
MIFNSKHHALGLTIALLLACTDTTSAQQPKRPAAAKKPPAARPPAAHPAPKASAPTPPAASAQPPATPAAAAKSAATQAPIDLGPQPEKNPAVLAILEMPRTKPADYLQAIIMLIDLGRVELARPIMDDLAKLQLTDAERIELVDQLGSASMLKLARAKELNPAAATFSDECMVAASAATNNPQRIDALIKQLADPSPEARLIAQHDLAASGTVAATKLLEAFARETDRTRRAALAAGITASHPLVEGMLLAMLDTQDAALRADVVSLLQHLNVLQAQPFFPATPSAAEQKLATALSSYARGTPAFTVDQDNQVELWQWNDATKTLTSARVPASQARIIWMAKLARALYQLRPDNPAYQRRALLLTFEAAPTDPQQVVGGDTRLLNNTLADALKEHLPHAAVAAAKALAQRGDQSVLLTADGKPSPLADALTSPNRNVRFAALWAIMALDPSSPYPGSSRVPDALAWFAASSSERRAIVAMPTQAAASELASLLAADELTAEATKRGREAVKMARDMTDVEAIFVDIDILLPGIREVLYELRTNPTTGEVPIAILAADGELEAAQRLAEEHQRVIAVPRPHSPEIVANTLNQLFALAPADFVPPEKRAAQAKQAQEWLAKLASENRNFYVIRRAIPVDLRPAGNTPPETLPER